MHQRAQGRVLLVREADDAPPNRGARDPAIGAFLRRRVPQRAQYVL
jgi:hypothetical protein